MSRAVPVISRWRRRPTKNRIKAKGIKAGLFYDIFPFPSTKTWRGEPLLSDDLRKRCKEIILIASGMTSSVTIVILDWETCSASSISVIRFCSLSSISFAVTNRKSYIWQQARSFFLKSSTTSEDWASEGKYVDRSEDGGKGPHPLAAEVQWNHI